MTPRSASLSAVSGSACTNGWIVAGKRSVEKKMPEKIHIGTIARFMRPDTPSMVRGRAATSSPRPLKARAPRSDNRREEKQRASKRHAEREAREEQQGSGFRNQEDQPRRELRAKQMAVPDGRRDQPLQQVAVSRDHQREADAPHAGAHQVHPEQAWDEEVDVAGTRLGHRRASRGERIGTPRRAL